MEVKCHLFYHEKDSWPLTVMGVVALFLLITLTITLKENIINELKIITIN